MEVVVYDVEEDAYGDLQDLQILLHLCDEEEDVPQSDEEEDAFL